MSAKRPIYADKRRRLWMGRIYRQGERAQTFRICSFDEAEIRIDKSGTARRRSVQEISRFVEREFSRLKKSNDQKTDFQQIRLERAICLWLGEIENQRSPRTHELYKQVCGLFLSNRKNLLTSDLTTQHFANFAGELRFKKIAEATINKYQRCLQSFVHWCNEQGMSKNIKIRKQIITRKKPVIWKTRDLLRFEKHLLQYYPDDSNFLAKQNRTRAYFVARYALLRGSEIVYLRISDIDLASNCLHVADSATEGHYVKDREERIVPLHPVLRAFIEDDSNFRTAEDEWWLDTGFGERYYNSVDSLSQSMSREVRRLGLHYGQKPLHAFRSTGITELLSAGKPLHFVQQIAGHARPETTLAHYVDEDQFDLQDTIDSLRTSSGLQADRPELTVINGGA